jgi:hypothetical protein
MTLGDLANLAEIIGVIAVVASLVFVGLQIRDNSRAVKDQNRWTRLTEINATARMLAENPEALRANTEASSPAWRSMLQDYADAWGVSFDDAAIVAWTQSTYIWTHWARWRAMKTKQDEVELKNIVTVYYSMEPMASDIRHPTARALYDPEFIDWVDDILKSIPQDETSRGTETLEEPNT